MRRLTCALLLALLLLWQSPALGRQSKPSAPIRHYFPGWLRVTQYTWTGYRTASGQWPYWGECAADPTIPFGARIVVKGLGTFTVLDRGSAVYGAHIDIFVPFLMFRIRDYYAHSYWYVPKAVG